MGSDHIEILLLGGFEVRIRERRLHDSDIPGRKAPALFKLIALSRDQQLLRDLAIDALWPDLEPAKASAQLYKVVHLLRKILAGIGPDGADEWLSSERDTLGLRAPGGVVTDAGRFDEAARQALRSRLPDEMESAAALYTGDLLPMDLYASWAEQPREQLRQLRIDLLLALSESRQQRGDLSAAAQSWREVLQQDPTLERAHRGLMEVYATLGQRDRALKQYGLCMDALADEFGVAPSADTRALYQRIDAQAQAAAPAVPAAALTLAAPGAPAATCPSRRAGSSRGQPPAGATPLVARSEECRRFDTALAALVTGSGACLALTGPAGIGKTRLIQEFIARAGASGCQVLSGAAYEMEGSGAYGPVIDLLQDALRQNPVGGELLPAEVAGLLPTTLPSAQPVPNSDPRAAQTYLFAGIARFLRRRAEDGPLLLVLENLHDADRDTLELIHYLARELRDAPVLLTLTARSDESIPTDTSIGRLLQGLERGAGLANLTLTPLTAAQQHQLLQQHHPLKREESDAVFRLAQGNPLYALELQRVHGGRDPSATEITTSSGIDTSLGSLPPSLLALIRDRVARLPAPVQEVLTLAAVLGEDIDYDLLRLLWRQRNDPADAHSDADPSAGDADLLDLLDPLLAAHLLDERGLGFGFRHAIYRQGVYESASRTRRRVLHARVARQLVRIGDREHDLPVESIAYHYRAAGDARQAAHFLTLAGQRAAVLYAHQEALSRYREALALLEPLQRGSDTSITRICGQLHTHIGDTCRAGGYLAAARAAYAEALSQTRDLPLSQGERVDLHCKLALVAIFTTDMDQAGQQLAAAWACAPEDAALHARLHILRALYLWHCNRLEEAAAYAHRALTLAEAEGAALETAQACEILAMAYLPLGRWQEGLELEKRRLHHGRWSPDLVVATDAHLCLWEYHIHDDDMLESASGFMREVASEADRLGDVRCVAICHYALGTIHLWQGDTDAALSQLDQSLGLHERVGSAAGMAYVLSRSAVLHTLADAIDLGWQFVQKGIEAAQRASIRDHCLQRLYGTGIWNRLRAGDQARVDELVALSEALLEAAGPCTACSLDLYPWLALHYLERGDIDRAANCAESLAGLAAKTGNPVGEAFAAILHCGVARARGDGEWFIRTRDEAMTRMEKAVGHGARSPMTWLFDRLTAPA